MGYAFEGVPWHELPDGERFSWRYQDAVVRDSFLNHAELMAQYQTLQELGVKDLAHGHWKRFMAQ